MRTLETIHAPLTHATHRPLKDITMKTKIDVPNMTPTPIENDAIFTMLDIKPVEEPARKKDWLDITITVLKGATALATGFLLGLAMAWYLYTN